MSAHIERMREELNELYDKYLKASFFLNQETANPKFTDENQRALLDIQVNIMFTYITALELRIKYDVNKK
ncbi:MAG: crAss001_48 related protein [Paraclostridium sp.]